MPLDNTEITLLAGAQLPAEQEGTPEETNELIEILTRAVASWFVRQDNRFYSLGRLANSISASDLQRVCIYRFEQLYPEKNITNRILKAVFSRAIDQKHGDRQHSIPVWNGRSECRPSVPERVIWQDGYVLANTWKKPDYRALGGGEANWGLYHDFVGRVFTEETDRRAFTDWLSWCLQNEGEKPTWAPFLYSKMKGTGKSMLCGLARKLFGQDNSVTQNSVAKLTSQFNAPILQRKLVISEELQLRANSTQGNTLKTYITETSTTTEMKGKDLEQIEQCCVFIFTSNHLPFWIEANERRFWVMGTDHAGHASGPEAEEFGDFAAEFVAFMNEPENIAALYQALMAHQQLNSFNAKNMRASSIDTPLMKQIHGASGQVVQEQLEEVIAERKLTSISQQDLIELFATTLKAQTNRMRYLMADLGWRKEDKKWGGVDYSRVIWIHPDFQMIRGEIVGTDGKRHPVGDFSGFVPEDIHAIADLDVVVKDDKY